MIGVIGEAAYAKFAGKRRDSVSNQGRILTPESKEGDKADFDDEVDVKTITWTGSGAEMKMPPEAFNAKPWIKRFVLVKLDCDALDESLRTEKPFTVVIAGSISRERFAEIKQTRDYGHGPHYMVREEDLDLYRDNRSTLLADWM